MSTIAQIIDFITDDERNAVIDRYIEMFDAALSHNDTAELGNLLALAAYWDNVPSMRPTLTEAANKVASFEGLSIPEKRVNTIAAEIHTKIDIISGKCNSASSYCEDNTLDLEHKNEDFVYYGIR